MRGNPRLRKTGPLEAKIIFRVTCAQEAMIVAMCERDRLTVADLLRTLIEEGAQRRQMVPADAGMPKVVSDD